MLLRTCTCLLLLLLTGMQLNAQLPDSLLYAYPAGYFRPPLDIPLLLAGSFAECRPNHLHSGIDIKTQGIENLPVKAVAEGFISRIKLENGGYGHALYVNHPNGFTSVYAHLNNFAPPIQAFTRKMQYKNEKWFLDTTLPPTQFRVKKGDIIAFSGNTGSSTAPHLHFELRQTQIEHPLNVQQFDLAIIDTLHPVFQFLALYNETISYRIASKPLLIPCKKENDSLYVLIKDSLPSAYWQGDTLLYPYTEVKVGIAVTDWMDKSHSSLSYFYAMVKKDDIVQIGVLKNSIAFEETRYVNASMDYDLYSRQDTCIEWLFALPGNAIKHFFAMPFSHRGVMPLQKNTTHKMEVKVYDNSMNTTKLCFYIKYAPGPVPKYIPQGSLFKWNATNTVADSNINFTLDEKQLYNDLWFKYYSIKCDNALSDTFSIHYPEVPVHHSFTLKIKTKQTIEPSYQNKIVLQYSNGKSIDGKAAKYLTDGWVSANTKNFGKYWLEVDTTAPKISPAYYNGIKLKRATKIELRIADATTSVKQYRATIDNRWIPMEQNGKKFVYAFENTLKPGRHTFKITATDENGNTGEYAFTFMR